MRGLFLFFAILAAACVQATFGNEKSGKQGENRLLRKISNGQLILTDEKLSKSQLKKIAKSDNLESLKLGQNPEACFLEPGGIEILGTSRTLEKISLYVSNFSQLNISALSKIPTLHTLEIGGGPFLYDSDGERQPAVIENYCAILTDETVKQILTIKSVKKLK